MTSKFLFDKSFFNEPPYVENFAKPTFCLLFAKKSK